MKRKVNELNIKCYNKCNSAEVKIIELIYIENNN